MVHFPVIPVTNPVSSEAQITTARGEHLLTLGAGDMPSLLKQAMPLLPWGTTGGDTTLPYCEFLSLLLVVMWVDEDGVDKSLSGSIIADSALHRVWTELRKGFTDVMWVGQTRGQFLLTLVTAAESQVVDSELLRLRDGDLVDVPALALTEGADRAWLNAMKFVRGMLGDAVLGRLAVAASIYYYSELVVGPNALHHDNSAFAVHIMGLRISTLACRPAADAATAMRPPTMAYAVCDFVRNSTWEVEMEHQVRAGPARELDARSRAIHAAADGLGKAAEAVVAPMLPHILCAPGLDLLKAMLTGQDGSLAATRSLVNIIRQWQLVLELPAPESVVLTSIRRVQQLLHLRRHTLSTSEVLALPPAERPDSIAPAQPARRDGTNTWIPGGDGSKGTGSKRHDSGMTEKLLLRKDYIDTKRAGLLAIQAGRMTSAIRIFLTGTLPLPPVDPLAPNAVRVRPAPLVPLLVFHVILFTSVEAWSIDKDLRPLEGLRAHLSRYFGEVVASAMGGGFECSLPALATAFGDPAKLGENLDVENDGWRAALNVMHGVQTPPSAANPGMPVIPKAMVYTSAYHLMATREIFLALLRAYGVSLEEPVANGLCLLSPAAFLDAVIDRHNHNGVMAVLALGVRDSCLTLIRGVLAAFGTRRAAAYSSRDLGAELPTLLIVAPCSCLDDFDKTTASYALLLERQRADRLKSTPVVPAAAPASARAPDASELALYEAWKRGAHIDEVDTSSSERKEKKQVRMPPTRVRDSGKLWECGKAVYDLAKGHAQLKALNHEDGDETCLFWQLTQGRGFSGAQRLKECRHKEKHKNNPGAHLDIVGFRPGDCRVDEGYVRGARPSEAGSKRKGPGGRKANPNSGDASEAGGDAIKFKPLSWSDWALTISSLSSAVIWASNLGDLHAPLDLCLLRLW